jgi:nucleotide-binding universal stress UspA family protein/predicted Ser/Thr protein kinase
VTVAAPLEPGTIVDGFRVEERVHAGGMAVIYRVTGPDVGFPLVMKVPRLGPGEPAESVVSYEVEAMVLAVLEGSHVPRFVAAGDLARVPYVVMEHVEGRSLKEWVGHGPLAADEVARLGAAVATALHALHRQETLHLDVKPSNVVVRPSGEAVLIDFGLAHHAHYPDLLAEEFRRPIGSAPYLSPEQIVGVRDDPRSDTFSLGVVLYELATGRLPFGEPRGAGALRKRLYRDPPPPRAIVPGMPPWLQEVILRCLEVDPEDRYASAAQVAFDLSHPADVEVTARGLRTRRLGAGRVLRRWIRAAAVDSPPHALPSAQLRRASIVVAAIATHHTNEAQLEALRGAVGRLVDGTKRTRLACVTVIRPSPELGGSEAGDNATERRIAHLVRLRHWAEPLRLAPGCVSYHVLESSDPAEAIVEYARVNQVDHVVVGAPPSKLPLQGLFGTVATRVTAASPCTVTIVRARGDAAGRRTH